MSAKKTPLGYDAFWHRLAARALPRIAWKEDKEGFWRAKVTETDLRDLAHALAVAARRGEEHDPELIADVDAALRAFERARLIKKARPLIDRHGIEARDNAAFGYTIFNRHGARLGQTVAGSHGLPTKDTAVTDFVVEVLRTGNVRALGRKPKRGESLAHRAPYARGTVAEPRGENPAGLLTITLSAPEAVHIAEVTGDNVSAGSYRIARDTLDMWAEAVAGGRPRVGASERDVLQEKLFGLLAGKRAKNPLPSPANIIANVALTTAARAVAGRFMNSLFDDGKGEASATDAGDAMPALTREENPVKKKSIVPPLNRWHTFAGDNYRWYARNNATESRPGDMHYFDLGPRTDARGKQRGWQVNEWNAGGGGHLPVRYFGTRNEALRYVREKMGDGRAPNPVDIHIDIQSHNTKGKNVRAKNPYNGVWPESIRRFMDDELYYAKTGKYAPTYLKQNRAPELVRFLAKDRATARAYDSVLNDAWRARKENPVGDYYADESPEARELFLFATNDAGLYRRNILPAIENLAKKLAKGQYDKAKAAKLFEYTANFAADEYARQHGTPGQKGHHLFKPADRRIVAREFVEYFDEQIRDRAAELGAKKRGKNPNALSIDAMTGADTRPFFTPEERAKLSYAQKGKARAKAEREARGKIVLALAGHPKGTGYYTGQTWDTELCKAIRFDSVAGAKAAAKLLAAKLPKGTRIEVRSV